MKTSVPSIRLIPVLILLLLLQAFAGSAQTIPELIFRNPSLVSGSANQDGAVYRFANVATGTYAMDAIVTVNGRSANDVVIRSIDSSGVGWDKAFQPTLGIPNVGANREWWVEFEIQFVNAGTMTAKKIDTFYVTGLDIDGDGGHLNEWAQMMKIQQVQLAPGTALLSSLLATVNDLLDLDNNGYDYRVNGPITNYGNIDTSSAAVMATYKYAMKDKIKFRIGGKTNLSGGSSGAAGMRMNSLWFKQFRLSNNSTLPVNLIDFNSTLNNQKVDLKWVTAGEKNVSRFDIERSVDGINFKQAAIVFAYGNTSDTKNYTYSDDISNIKSSIVYYRLRMVDIDGKSELSEVRVVRSKQSDALKLVSFPNPTPNELKVTLPASWQNKPVLLELYSPAGQRIKAFQFNNASQTQSLSLDGLKNGLYVLRGSCATETAQENVVKY